MVKRASVILTFSSILICRFPHDKVNEPFFTGIQSLSVNSPWWNLEYQNIMCGKVSKNMFVKYSNAHCEEAEFDVIVLYKGRVFEITEDQKDTNTCFSFKK